MAKKPMGITGVFSGGTGMEALAAATGASTPPPAAATAPELHAVVALPVAPQPARQSAGERHMATNVRLRPDQWEALRREALNRALARRGGKADASEVLREIIDAWLEKRGELGA